MTLKVKKTDWAHRYQTSLQRYLCQKLSSNFKPACKLGSQVADLGMETLELAQIHEQSLIHILSHEDSSLAQKKIILKAKNFFNETNCSIEKTHIIMLRKEDRLNQLTHELLNLTAELKASRVHIEKEIIKRKKAESALVKSNANHVNLMQISRRLRLLLRSQTQAILTTQEKERKKTSRVLQDKIAQALLGINIELLAMKVSDKKVEARFSNEIDSLKHFARINSNKG